MIHFVLVGFLYPLIYEILYDFFSSLLLDGRLSPVDNLQTSVSLYFVLQPSLFIFVAINGKVAQL